MVPICRSGTKLPCEGFPAFSAEMRRGGRAWHGSLERIPCGVEPRDGGDFWQSSLRVSDKMARVARDTGTAISCPLNDGPRLPCSAWNHVRGVLESSGPGDRPRPVNSSGATTRHLLLLLLLPLLMLTNEA
jgi:hypothetical protein